MDRKFPEVTLTIEFSGKRKSCSRTGPGMKENAVVNCISPSNPLHASIHFAGIGLKDIRTSSRRIA